MTAPIRPKPPSVCNPRDRAAPRVAYLLGCADGRAQFIADFIAEDNNLPPRCAPRPDAPIAHIRFRPKVYDELVAMNKLAEAAQAGLEMIVRARKAVRK